MQLEAIIKRSLEFTWCRWLSQLADALGVHDQSILKEYLEESDLDAVYHEEAGTVAETSFVG
jgi:hypothetical protein